MSRVNSKTKLTSKQLKKGNGKKQNSAVDLEAAKKTEIPQLAWKIISETATEDLKETDDMDKVASKLADILALTKSNECLQEAAELDYFVAGFWYASSEWELTNEQISAFITLLHTVLHNLKTRKLSLSENLKELHTMMANIGVPNVLTALECFTSEVATTALQYLQSTVFQHYALFQYLFTEELETDTHTAQVEIEVPNTECLVFPSPLEESLPLELYLRCRRASDTELDSGKEGKEVISQEQSEDTIPSTDIATVSSLDEDEMQLSSEQLKGIMEDLARTTLEPFQTQMFRKIKEKEDTITSRLSRLEKALNV